jgi:DNA helicase-2/ATP-dependent DNA helicase PcrA
VAGVTLASFHSAKGLEWDAVFLVGLVEGVLPTLYAKTDDAVEEERRLLYVGITRARHVLTLSYAAARTPGGRQRRPCRFLPLAGGSGQDGRGGSGRFGRREVREADGTRRRLIAVPCRVCGATLQDPAERKLGRCTTCPSNMDDELYARLKQWRLRAAAAQQVPAYVVFTDATLIALAERRPGGMGELAEIAGIGPHKLSRYGEAVLALIRGAEPEDLLAASAEGASGTAGGGAVSSGAGVEPPIGNPSATTA